MLQNLDGWDFSLLGIAVIVAVYTLVIMMNRHRDKTVERLRKEVMDEAKKAKKVK